MDFYCEAAGQTDTDPQFIFTSCPDWFVMSSFVRGVFRPCPALTSSPCKSDLVSRTEFNDWFSYECTAQHQSVRSDPTEPGCVWRTRQLDWIIISVLGNNRCSTVCVCVWGWRSDWRALHLWWISLSPSNQTSTHLMCWSEIKIKVLKFLVFLHE